MRYEAYLLHKIIFLKQYHTVVAMFYMLMLYYALVYNIIALVHILYFTQLNNF